jgi:hypothetical protein
LPGAGGRAPERSLPSLAETQSRSCRQAGRGNGQAADAWKAAGRLGSLFAGRRPLGLWPAGRKWPDREPLRKFAGRRRDREGEAARQGVFWFVGPVD